MARTKRIEPSLPGEKHRVLRPDGLSGSESASQRTTRLDPRNFKAAIQHRHTAMVTAVVLANRTTK